MKIYFYEEFPTKENLKKLKLIDFSSKIFVAAKSIAEFKKLERQIKKINRKVKIIYWPLVKNSYWISPFSNTKDLVELFTELDRVKNHLLIDLEPPILNKRLFLKNIFNFRKNKRLIKKFMEDNKNRITTAQYPNINSRIIKFFGLDYNIQTEKDLMYYSSMIPKVMAVKIKGNLMKIEDKEKISIGLGTIAKGILGDESILLPKELEKDLEFVKKAGFKRVIIFRLGGLDKKYLEVIKKFLR